MLYLNWLKQVCTIGWFFICYLAAPQPTLGYYREDIFSRPIESLRFDISEPGDYREGFNRKLSLYHSFPHPLFHPSFAYVSFILIPLHKMIAIAD